MKQKASLIGGLSGIALAIIMLLGLYSAMGMLNKWSIGWICIVAAGCLAIVLSSRNK